MKILIKKIIFSILLFFSRIIREKQKLGGASRSNSWPSVRKDFLILNPICEACGETDFLQVHHIKPFNKHPELELDHSNLITLCESNIKDCHFCFGHLYSWKSWNENVREDAKNFRYKIINRQ